MPLLTHVFGALLTLVSVNSGAFPPNTGVRFSEAQAQELIDNCLSPNVRGITGVWTPSDSDIARADRVLRDALDSAPQYVEAIPEMRRQYIGVTMRHRRAIYIKARVEPENERWRTEPCGGGRPLFAAIHTLGQSGIMIMALGPGWN